MPETVRLYEVVYIIAPDRSDEQVQATIDKYATLITSHGGVVERTDVWERRRLAYEIKGYTEGLYVIVIFRGVPSIEAELRRVFRISEDTLRFIIVRPDDDADVLARAPEPFTAPAASVPAAVETVAIPTSAPEAIAEPTASAVEEAAAVPDGEASEPQPEEAAAAD